MTAFPTTKGAWVRSSSVRIHADAETVFNLIAGVELWPAIVPHIDSVRVLRRSGSKRLIAVRARWHGLPLGYRAVVDADAQRQTFTIRHVSVLTGGSIATWVVEPQHDSSTRADEVELRVDACVSVPLPVFGPLLAREFAGGRVARELGTLMMYRIKEIAEGASLAGRE